MTRLLIIGLGPIGIGCARAARCAKNTELVALVDIDPNLVGRSAADVTACEGKDTCKPAPGSKSTPTPVPGSPAPGTTPAVEPGPIVTDDLDVALQAGPDVAIVTTTSKFDALDPLLRRLIAAGVSVVSSCEEMAYPWYRHAALADDIHDAAAAADVRLLGTGVNPGYVMDTLAVSLASMVRKVTAVRCVRRVDAALRREPLQRKVGATMTVEQFNALKADRKIGHQGIAESVALIAAGLGREVEPGSVIETLEPVLADQATPSALGLISPGRVRGMRNTATWSADNLTITLDLTMAVGEPDPMDKVILEGPVSFEAKVPGSIPGDSATIAALINQLPLLPSARPGLLTMLDLPPAGCMRA